jgi:hypothetical protein
VKTSSTKPAKVWKVPLWIYDFFSVKVCVKILSTFSKTWLQCQKKKKLRLEKEQKEKGEDLTQTNRHGPTTKLCVTSNIT